MKKKIFLILLLVILLFCGIPIFYEYMANHTYYQSMLSDGSNWGVLAVGLLFSFLPLAYIIWKKKKTLLGFIIWLFVGLTLFGLSYIGIKDEIIGSGLIVYAINCLVIFALAGYFVLSTLSIGHIVSEKILKLRESNIINTVLKFGIGLAVFLLLNYCLIMLHIFYGVIVWAIFIAWGYIIYTQKSFLSTVSTQVMDILDNFSIRNIKNNRINIMGAVLLLLSFLYFYYGFSHAFIPYPTAWDANHAYMFWPRVFAYNNGFYWNDQTIWPDPMLRYSYIGYWFKLIISIQKGFWLSPDNIAVEMNFLSGVFVLIFGLVLVQEVINFFSKKHEENLMQEVKHIFTKEDDEKNKRLTFNMGWMFFILWLTSGMGAFLVFVDNKTDLGIMALVILAILSGFVFLNLIKENLEAKNINKYLILSGFLFAIAIMSKPTALFDVMNFGLYLGFLWFGIVILLGLFLLGVGVISKANLLTISEMISSKVGTWFLGGGTILSIAGIANIFIKKQIKYLKYICIWGISIVITLAIFKGSYVYHIYF